MSKYLVLPDCSDLNRGDQALVWETIRLAKDAGFVGDFYIQSEEDLSRQSISKGIKTFSPILKHPSRNRRTNNIRYSLSIKLKWGFIAIFDLLRTLNILLFAKTAFVKLFMSRKELETINLYKSAETVFVKGGGFLQSYGGITAFYYTYYHLFPIYLANRIGVPVYIMPNSFGPLDGYTVKWQVQQALSKCKLVSCRESISYNYMSTTFPNIKFKLTNDLGFYLPAAMTTSKAVQYSKKKVAITVRPYRFPEHKSNNDVLYENYINAMVGLTRYIIQIGLYPVFVQHTLAVNVHEDDLRSIELVTSHLEEGTYGIFSNESYDCKNMKQLYSTFDYIVGTRFHSVIFSIASGVPAIVIAYGGNKSRGIMKDNGLDEYVVDIDSVSESKLISLFSRLIENGPQIKNQLELMSSRMKEERKHFVDELKMMRLQ